MNLPTKERLENLQFDIAQYPHTYSRRGYELHIAAHGYSVLTIIEDALRSCGLPQRLSLDSDPLDLLKIIDYALQEGTFKERTTINLL